MPLTNQERKAKAALLKDSQSTIDKVAFAQRKPIALAPPNVIDTEIARLTRDKEFRRLAKMDPESRRLAVLHEIRDREPVQPGKPHPRIAKIETLIDSIVENSERELSHYQLAVLVLAQHQAGMCPETADQLWRELVDQETNFLNTKRQAAIDQQSALIEQLQAIDTSLLGIADAPPPNGYAILSRAIPQYGSQYGVGVSPQEYSEIAAAEGNAEAEQAVAAKYAAKIQTYMEAANAGENQ